MFVRKDGDGHSLNKQFAHFADSKEGRFGSDTVIDVIKLFWRKSRFPP